ncbi:hypothetical protein C1H46_039855 [Malus baccata]|uniref:Uncharacterized protein n=1 Tax=Malus baccata TaxID=106549 RepID=A0A540KK58_MALBA|nr:hypothetical protein C1H46_039855 [Malus baccata]
MNPKTPDSRSVGFELSKIRVYKQCMSDFWGFFFNLSLAALRRKRGEFWIVVTYQSAVVTTELSAPPFS